MSVSRLPQLHVNEHGLELERRGTRAFPCAAYECDPLVDDVPWHWHPELEFVFVREGSLAYAAAGRRFELREGDAAFVAGGVPHAEFPLESRHALEGDLVCDARFLYGTKDSVIYRRFFSRLGIGESPRAVRFNARGEPWEREAAKAIARAHEAMATGEAYFELAVRELLTRAVLLAVDRGAGRDEGAWPTDTDSERLKAMVTLVEQNYARRVTVADIARAAHVSEREAQRTFRECTGETPVGYLVGLRLRVAARMLRHGDEPVGAIAHACGFDTQSYFCRRFKAAYGRTPLEWRRSG